MNPAPRERTGMVRSYAPMGGEAEPARATLDEATLLVADATVARGHLGSTEARIMELVLPGVLSVAETSAHLAYTSATVKVAVAALAASGHLIVRSPAPAQAQRDDITLLERIRDGLRAL